MAATTASGITTLDGLAGKVICVGAATTYQYWLDGTLEPGGCPAACARPARRHGVHARPPTRTVRQAATVGRNDFAGWLSSSTTVDGAIKAGTPMRHGR